MNEDGADNADYWYGYHALIKLHIRPLDYANMSFKEKALTIAYIDLYVEDKKKQQSKIKKPKR